jgi:hypothetical protein
VRNRARKHAAIFLAPAKINFVRGQKLVLSEISGLIFDKKRERLLVQMLVRSRALSIHFDRGF